MYHSISDRTQNSPAYFQTVTRPAVFAEQMRLLKGAGYAGVTLTAGLDWLRSPSRPSGLKPVVITFDDGFRNFLTSAVPVLQQQGFSATMYLPTAFIREQPRQFKKHDCLTWSDVIALHSAGIEFGSHTVTHPTLTELGWAEIQTELLVSRQTIETRLQSVVTAFAYPYAFPQDDPAFLRRFERLLKEVGYDSCVTTKVGRVAPADNCFRLRRLPVNSHDDAALFLAKLEGAYDWLGSAQAAVKRIKRITRSSNPAATPSRTI